MFLTGLAIFILGICLYIVLLGGDVINFINLPSLLLIFIPLLAVLTATRSFKVLYSGFRSAIYPREPLSEELRGNAASLFRLLSKTTALSSAIGFLVCIMNTLMALDFSDPNAINILGGNIAVAMLIPLYGLALIAIVFEPVVYIMKKRYETKRRMQ